MLAFFRRRHAGRRYVWMPSIDFSDRRIAATLATLSSGLGGLSLYADRRGR